jgi:prepilin-type N-terminal cleavage/methylation domain-containing protein/prepilin-type processing-associated H-X9-DG protein
MTRELTPNTRTGPATGFTLIELLVVISIIALLVGILLPALGAARRSAQTSKCLSNVRQIAMASQYYANDFDDYLPLIPSFNRQGDQVYLLNSYLGGDQIFLCPSAEATSSSGQLWNWQGPNFFGNGRYESKFKPKFPTELLWNNIPKYTDYKLNDNIGTTQALNTPPDGVIDRPIGQLPYTTWTVVAIDIDWGSTNEDGSIRNQDIARHGNGENLSFLDGHSERLDRKEYRDPLTARKDPVGNNVWYRWGNPDKVGLTSQP